MHDTLLRKLLNTSQIVIPFRSAEKERIDFDDKTLSYFWRAHTFTVLLFLIGCLIYVGVIEDPLEHNTEYNSRRGLLAALFFWVALGMTIMPDGPFLRPHPALWRFAFAVSIVYQLLLIFILFQSPNTTRRRAAQSSRISCNDHINSFNI